MHERLGQWTDVSPSQINKMGFFKEKKKEYELQNTGLWNEVRVTF